MLKKEVRKEFRQKRQELTFQQKEKYDDLLLIQFQKLALPYLSTVLSFYPIEENKEINTFIITDYLKFKNPGLRVAYPRTDLFNKSMSAVISNESTSFHLNVYNILEPAEGEILPPSQIDLVLIPLLAFDLKGHRVGYGKGYYDRFLQQCKKICIKIGVCYFEPVSVIEDAHEFDVPLNFCITPQQVYVF